jgi:thiol-disulfide isomerase/thioredoxin
VKALSAYNDTIYIDKVGIEDAPSKRIDSAIIKENEQVVVWKVPAGEEAVYRIHSTLFNRCSFLVVSDSAKINVDAKFISNNYKVTGSPATASLINFINNRIALAEKGRQITKRTDSLKKNNAPQSEIEESNKRFDQSLRNYYNYGIDFADTVSSPAVFMQAYYTIDFGREYGKLKSYILKAAARFPNYQPIQKLKKEELATIKIYEEEYNIGDILPGITLPDQNGFNVGTSAYKGKYYLIDFWASWCQQCLPFKEAERNLLKKTDGKINIVSVAIDSQRDDWSHLIQANQYTWPQLIDEGMWKGIAVRTLKFDSIPFNFLVDPQGRIIGKALNASNLEKTVQSHLK